MTASKRFDELERGAADVAGDQIPISPQWHDDRGPVWVFSGKAQAAPDGWPNW